MFSFLRNYEIENVQRWPENVQRWSFADVLQLKILLENFGKFTGVLLPNKNSKL